MAYNLVVMQSKVNLDKVGACASAICAVHCALTGVALGLLSVMGLGFLGNTLVDVIFIGIAAFVGILAVRHGINKHNSYVPALFFVVGLVCILTGHFAFGHDHSALGKNGYSTLLNVLGGVCLVLFHYVNWRLQKAHHSCSCAHH